ncbi:unnamed protein product [Clonostachys byssicola]|uniref:Protein yippee-like n=1 Tax=Clonostachys byssicola TaxID=160290 RepID=A0A9N9UML2_9HYPO|nr:unnamed protein product [Clonostachys byssicola]
MQIQVPPAVDQQAKVYDCKTCEVPLALERSRIARHQKYQGRDGPAFLFKETSNIHASPPFEMEMTTGRHTVRNISCAKCDALVGWMYVNAPRPSEQYKVGNYMLEKELLCEQVEVHHEADSPL